PYYTDRERSRHEVRPGLTGYAQVAGRNDLLWNGRLELDVRYVEARSWISDFRILVRTVRSLSSRAGVSVVAGDSGEPLDVARGYPVYSGYTIRRFERPDIPARVRWMDDART